MVCAPGFRGNPAVSGMESLARFPPGIRPVAGLEIKSCATEVCDKSPFPCPHLSDGEMGWKYRNPGFGRNHENQRSEIIPLSFAFLRASVPPWCKGLVFMVAASQRGKPYEISYFSAIRAICFTRSRA